jgi:succinylarginine dihydrolase
MPQDATTLIEANFDGLVGPTHNYAGLSFGNVASESSTGSVSRPRDAALQGLAKMRALGEMGLVQGIIPPQERPHVPTLRRLGFTGSDERVIESAAKQDAILLAQVSSASCMWTANAATVGPSVDAADGKLHLTVANLRSMAHRFIEGPQTARTLRAMFTDREGVVVHEALPGADAFGDEGAANHTRLHDGHGGPGVHVFVYGAHHANRAERRPVKFPARQTLEASRAVARLHGLEPTRTVFAQQNPDVIDSGAFHNDVVAVGSGPVLLYHERAFADEATLLQACRSAVGGRFRAVRVSESQVPVSVAVATYLFNSQLVQVGDGYTIIAPTESRDHPAVRVVIEQIVADPTNPISAVRFFDLRESMRNGGGPACLRLRVPLTQRELANVTPGCVLSKDGRADEGQISRLENWVRKHYRETLTPSEIADPKLLYESRAALDELSQILGLGSMYEFQGAASR